jgi:hypothetical protein
MSTKTATIWAVCLGIWLWAAESAWANGGPFVVRYPEGDPAAKGVLARLDPTLKPARETRLRVVEEHLTIAFEQDRPFPSAERQMPPLASVSAAYTIENPTDQEVAVDFGFPILRGIYLNPMAMMPIPDVAVTVDGQPCHVAVISNSLIYATIREQSRETIEASIAADPRLAGLVAAIRQPRRQKAAIGGAAVGDELHAYLVGRRKWAARDAALMVEYAGMDFGPGKAFPSDRWHGPWLGQSSLGAGSSELLSANLGPLAAIGEQKATQMFAQLAGCFDPQAAGTYEAIFAAWGGDVRSRSVDLATGKVRPREIELNQNPGSEDERIRHRTGDVDATVYARVDYLDENAKLSEAERAACRNVLANLPVVFTFAPMNLLHYRVALPAGKTQVVAVTYKQYAYRDTASPASYQLAYVVHPASLWDKFGPIHLRVQVPDGVGCRASVPFSDKRTVISASPNTPGTKTTQVYQTVLTRPDQKTGELLVGIDQGTWDAHATQKDPSVAAQ